MAHLPCSPFSWRLWLFFSQVVLVASPPTITISTWLCLYITPASFGFMLSGENTPSPLFLLVWLGSHLWFCFLLLYSTTEYIKKFPPSTKIFLNPCSLHFHCHRPSLSHHHPFSRFFYESFQLSLLFRKRFHGPFCLKLCCCTLEILTEFLSNSSHFHFILGLTH